MSATMNTHTLSETFDSKNRFRESNFDLNSFHTTPNTRAHSCILKDSAKSCLLHSRNRKASISFLDCLVWGRWVPCGVEALLRLGRGRGCHWSGLLRHITSCVLRLCTILSRRGLRTILGRWGWWCAVLGWWGWVPSIGGRGRCVGRGVVAVGGWGVPRCSSLIWGGGGVWVCCGGILRWICSLRRGVCARCPICRIRRRGRWRRSAISVSRWICGGRGITGN
mmetsp:Transcript_4028/g.6201  ORF Transcript_4028/g.6201 Transcript_4028/m.6201 type:complete len:223 (-) Transcript_4028:699-1367(-)